MPVIGSNRIFEIKDFQLHGSETYLNVYYYHGVGGGAYAAEQVAREFEDHVIDPAILLIQHSGITRQTIEVTEIQVDNNFFQGNSEAGTGSLAGVALPNFCAASFQLDRATKETRNGRKRIGGQTEEVAQGNFWTTGFQTVMDSVAVVLESVFVCLDGGDMEPVIVSKRRDTQGNLLPVAQWVYNDVASCTPIYAIKHQNTRLLGRGV